MSNQDKRKEKLELKFKQKAELVKAKQKVNLSIQELKAQIKLAKKQEIALAAQQRKEIIKEKQQTQEAIVKDRAEFYKQRALIAENKKYLVAKKRELKEQVLLAKAHNRQLLIKAKQDHQQSLLIAKQQKREEILKHKQKVEELRKEREVKLLEAQQQIMEKENDIQAFQVKQQELIRKKKIELLNKKAKLEADRVEAKSKAKEERLKKQLQARQVQQDLKELTVQQEAKLSKLKVDIESENFESSSRKQKQLEKETAKAALEMAKTYEAAKNATKKLEELNHETYQDELADVEAEKERIWQAETESKLDVNEWDDTNEERQELVKGVVIQSMGKRTWKIYEKANKQNTTLKLDKIKLPKEKIELIKEFQELKQNDNVTDIREFVKYVAYLTNRNENNILTTNKLAAVVVNVLQGKTLQFLDGYFSIERIGQFRLCKYEAGLNNIASKVVSLPPEPFYKKLEEVIMRKLKKGLVIKVNENIALKYQNDTIVVMHDLGFIK